MLIRAPHGAGMHKYALKVCGLDADAASWGVFAKRNLESGEIVATFGETTYLSAASQEGRKFENLHAQMSTEEKPLQYSSKYHLAEDRHAKLWVVSEQDKKVVRNRAGTLKRLRQALGPGVGPGIRQLVNHTCCIQHRNAEFQLTRALDGDLRRNASDEDGKIVLVIRAARRISSQEQILVHYNPGAPGL
jgi:hypothetical protein